MELSLNNYIEFIAFGNSFFGFVFISSVFVLISLFKPFLAVAVICVYTELPWSAHWKPFITLYPIYPMSFILLLKFSKKILKSLFLNKYKFPIILSLVLILWSLLTPFIYTASLGPAVTFTQNPNFHRAFQLIIVLFLLPAILDSQRKILDFIESICNLLIISHIVIVILCIFFVFTGHAIKDLHLMKVLDTPPIYWESGILILCLTYMFVNRKIKYVNLFILLMIAIFCLILGNSRTRYLATALCFFYYVYPYITKRFLVSFAILLLLISCSFFAMPNKAKNYLDQLITQRIEQSSSKNLKEITTGRTVAYEFAVDRWKSNPIFGVGSTYILPREKFYNTSKSMPRVHNYYLEILAGQGIVGFLLLFIILIWTFVKILHIAKINAIQVSDGRFVVSLVFFGIINWFFKESWGITYSAIALLVAYNNAVLEN